MLLNIAHSTAYQYDQPVRYALQRLRLRPPSTNAQTVLEWDLTITGGTLQAEYRDEHANTVELMSLEPWTEAVVVAVEGLVETHDTAGVTDAFAPAPLWLYQRSTPSTMPGERVQQLVDEASVDHQGTVADFHALASAIAERVSYEAGRTTVTTTAEEALVEGAGVCQDHAHVLIACARSLGAPARYVCGYLMMTDRIDQDAGHAWAEVWIEGLGWVGFDVSNGISPDERYVRTSQGLDYIGAAPTAGLWVGGGTENIHVTVQVEQ